MKNRLITLVILVGVLIYLIIEARNQGDLFIYLSASRDLFRGKDIYSIWYVDWFYYYYSVLFAILISPLNLLPAYVAQLLWLMLNAFFLYRTIKIIASYFNSPLLTRKQRQLLLILSIVFGLRFIMGNFHYQQVTILILYLILEGLELIFSGKKFAGALLIALGINIKMLPLVILPYLVYRREFKATMFVIISFATMAFIPALIIGIERNNFLLISWWNHINPVSSHHTLDVDEASFHSLSTLLTTLLIEKAPDTHALPIRRNIADMSITQLTYILNTIRLLLITFSIYFFRTKPFVSQLDKIHRFWEVSYLLLLVPLIFPHQQHYAFLFIVPAMCYIFYYLISQKNNITPFKFWALVVCCVISYLAGNLALLLGEFNAYYQHFKILTYGALIVIPMLAVCIPKSSNPRVNTR